MFLQQPTPRRTATSLDQRTHVVELCDQREARRVWVCDRKPREQNPSRLRDTPLIGRLNWEGMTYHGSLQCRT